MRRRVVITGSGIVSALGETPARVHAALCAGRRAFRETPFAGHEGAPARTAMIQDFSAAHWLGEVNTRPLERTGLLSICGSLRALEASSWTREQRREAEIDLVLATAFGSVETIARFDRHARLVGPKHASPLDFANTVINAPAGQTAIWHGLTGSNLTVCAGKVSSLCALGNAARRITHGWSATVLTGGVEGVCFETQTAFAQSGQLAADAADPAPFSLGRRGFLLGEGSAFFVLEAAEGAAARGVWAVAELSGWGSSYDPGGGREERSAMEACARAIRAALSSAATPPEEVDVICASACGSVAGDRIEIMALAEVFGDRLPALPLFAPAAALGETLGASGMIQTALLIESALAGRAPGTAGAERYDAGLPSACFSASPRFGEYRRGLSVSQGLDGSAAAVLVTIGR